VGTLLRAASMTELSILRNASDTVWLEAWRADY
jgi:hypothetical protein